MKNNIYKTSIKIVFGIIIGSLGTISALAVNRYFAKDISFNPRNSKWNVDNIEDAINDLYEEKMSNSSNLESMVGVFWDYVYTGAQNSFVVPVNGNYKLEAWGASGGDAKSVNGGKGGYASYTAKFSSGDKLYIVVGGKGNDANQNCSYTVIGNGYNGGGSVSCQSNTYFGSGGGGASHIAKSEGLLSEFEQKKEDLYIVAGGGGGSSDFNGTNGDVTGKGGAGGGISGVNGTNYSNTRTPGGGASQSSAGSTSNDGGMNAQITASFGIGCSPNKSYSSYMQVAGGGGLYGGGCGTHSGGGGGSGYTISGGILLSGDEAQPSNNNAIATMGNGFVRITFVG